METAKKGEGEIRAYRAPNNKITLTVDWNDTHPHLEGIWQLFEKEMKRQGWKVDDVEGETGKENGAEPRVKKGKQGPHRYSSQEKLDAHNAWDAIDQDMTPISLEEFLEEKFGVEAGNLIVPLSTFHGWRTQLRRNGLYPA